MIEGETIYKIFAACVPIILGAMGYQFQVIRHMQKQLDMCMEWRKDRGEDSHQL